MGEDDLEFTEEDMFSHLDGGSSNANSGKENAPSSNAAPLEKSRSEKLKRQRSNIPEATDIASTSTLEEDTDTRKSTEDMNPVSTHFSHTGMPSQSMTINRGKEMASRHRSTDLDTTENHVSRLGTSMPITIPGMEKAMANKAAAEKSEANQMGKFVPPHLLDQDPDESRAHSVNSGSLTSGSMAKRDRLLQRNKILRRTGFLEGATVEQGKAGSGALPELMDPLTRRLMPIKETYIEPSPRESFVEPSALSAALGTPRKDALRRSSLRD